MERLTFFDRWLRLSLAGVGGVRFACESVDDDSNEARREVKVEEDGTLWLDGAPKGRSSVVLLTELQRKEAP